ncbi:hypothetical protein AYO41_02075 [Verrucomicrobia bacterium SCGC AG-212-E04]|nr:hypothetical protein AYO41_02075 [Verrucomicrobia bacterium SCGC AG-212-E04]
MPLTKPLLPRVLVDLVHLQSGGVNGGIKAFIFELVKWLGEQTAVPLKFIFLTRSRTHAEVRDTLARSHDELVCVFDDRDGTRPRTFGRGPRERTTVPPPIDLAWQLEADLVYCPFGPPDHACAGIPTICFVADVLHRDYPASLSAAEILQREGYFQRLVAVADAIQCNSHYVMDRLHTLYGVSSERMFTVYNAIQARLQSRPHAGQTIAATGEYFFYPANAWLHKNHETLLVAYRLYRHHTLAAGRVPWKLVLTGHNDQRWDALKRVSASLGLNGDVVFHGYVEASHLHTLWREAGALVMPSLHEGFGIPLLEAMHYGVPVIASDATSLPEVGGDACLLVNARQPERLAEAMHRVATEPGLRDTLVERGSRREQAFSISHEAGRLLERIQMLTRAQTWRPFTQGVHADGWTEENALIGLPTGKLRCVLELETHPALKSRKVVLRTGDARHGSFRLPAAKPATIRVSLRPIGKPLHMHVPNAGNIATADARRHGIRLAAARLIQPDGQTLNLLP